MALRTTTSSTLLARLQDPDDARVWDEYVDRYRPLVVGYSRRLGLSESDAEDAAQDALLEFARAYRAGKYVRDRGRLRSWLFGITRHAALGVIKKNRRRAQPVGNTGHLLEDLEAREDLEELWESEWRAAVLRQCLEELRREVEPRTLEAFEKFVLQERTAADVATELGLSTNAVFCAKHRVLKRLRELKPLMQEIW